MPGKGSTGKKGGKKEGKKVETYNYDNITVRECLVWDAGKKKGSKSSANKENLPDDEDKRAHFRPVKGVLGKPIDRGYEFPETQQHQELEDQGSAAEALRGWPRYRKEREEAEAAAAAQQPPPESAKKSGKGKKKSKAEEEEDDGRDPWMGDVMSHKFLNDFIRQREAEAAKEQRKKDAKAKASQNPSWQQKTDIKANKTSQLRAIAAAQKVETSPFDLWQISKFKNNAEPTLTTFRSGKRADKDEKERRGMVNGEGDVAAVCTCGDDRLENYDGRAYYEDGDLEDRLDQQPAYDTARDAEF